MTGKLIAANEFKCEAGESDIDLPTETLSTGCYLLKVQVSNVPWITRLAKF